MYRGLAIALLSVLCACAQELESFRVEVSASGFQTYKRTGVIVSVQTQTRVDVAMAVGTTNETITVSAETTELQTDRTDVRTDLTSHTLENAPVPIGFSARPPGASTASRGTITGDSESTTFK